MNKAQKATVTYLKNDLLAKEAKLVDENLMGEPIVLINPGAGMDLQEFVIAKDGKATKTATYKPSLELSSLMMDSESL